jgi:hypothetical protein
MQSAGKAANPRCPKGNGRDALRYGFVLVFAGVSPVVVPGFGFGGGGLLVPAAGLAGSEFPPPWEDLAGGFGTVSPPFGLPAGAVEAGFGADGLLPALLAGAALAGVERPDDGFAPLPLGSGLPASWAGDGIALISPRISFSRSARAIVRPFISLTETSSAGAPEGALRALVRGVSACCFNGDGRAFLLSSGSGTRDN